MINTNHRLLSFDKPDGIICEGEFDNNNILHGKGKKIYNNGIVEEGDFSNGSLLGKGRIFAADGRVWKEGRFVYSDLIEGILISRTGDIFKGRFQREQLHGQGIVTYSNGDIKEGHFQDGRLNGKGRAYFSRSKNEWIGEFQDNLLHGQGEKRFSDGTRVIGNFHKHRLQGSGKIMDSSGIREEGTYENDRLVLALKG